MAGESPRAAEPESNYVELSKLGIPVPLESNNLNDLHISLYFEHAAPIANVLEDNGYKDAKSITDRKDTYFIQGRRFTWKLITRMLMMVKNKILVGGLVGMAGLSVSNRDVKLVTGT